MAAPGSRTSCGNKQGLKHGQTSRFGIMSMMRDSEYDLRPLGDGVAVLSPSHCMCPPDGTLRPMARTHAHEHADNQSLDARWWGAAGEEASPHWRRAGAPVCTELTSCTASRFDLASLGRGLGDRTQDLFCASRAHRAMGLAQKQAIEAISYPTRPSKGSQRPAFPAGCPARWLFLPDSP